MTTPAARKRKIAILGGGLGAMAAAYEITSQPDWRSKYDVSVYQIGWRLGGKAASGRNRRAAQRIEEHGLHILFGFYENTFDLMRRAYDELNRPRGSPLRRWSDAFKPHDTVIWMEQLEGRWLPWPVRFSRKPGTPGDGLRDARAGAPEPTIAELVLICLEETLRQFLGSRHGQPWWMRLWLLSRALFWGLGRSARLDASTREAACLKGARQQLRRTVRDDGVNETAASGVERQLDAAAASLEARLEGGPAIRDADARRFLWQIQLGLTLVRGLLADGVLFNGFDAIDDEELQDWLRKHGASDELLRSPFLAAAYDLTFAFAGGDPTRRSFAAGTALRNALRAYAYRGAALWKMQAGMGDVVFMPLYEVLRRRGVTFNFFHRVLSLHPSDDGASIDRISIQRQVALKAPEYDPRVHVNGLPCWPSEPLYDQIQDGDLIEQQQLDLEAPGPAPPGATAVTLTKGRDFDEVVLGIALGALPGLCTELAQRRPAWQAMLAEVKTVSTLALQLWLKPDLKVLGWHRRLRNPVLAGFVEPIDTWADMTHLIRREGWAAATRPGSIAYFCGPLGEPDGADRGEDAQAARNRVKEQAAAFIRNNLPALWPKAAGPTFWDLLLDPANGAGPARLDGQFWRANVGGSDRYVQSVPGSTRHRLPADRSGFDNLYLAGDWTRNGLDTGCAEAAVMSGKQAARGVTRSDPTAAEVPVYGEFGP